MFSEDRNNAIVQRGIDEALACRDMLEPVPARPSLLARVLATICAVLRAMQRNALGKQANRQAVPSQVSSAME
jgi:hypothetical protein